MIYIPKVTGTCRGAWNAVEVALKAKKENKNVCVYKEILHNERVISDLNKKGITCIDDLSKLTKDDVVVIRAHGEPKEVYEYLDKNNIKYYDATCPNVKKIHDIVNKKSSEGYNIIIVGKKNHPEVIGTLGWTNNKGIVISSKDELKIDGKTLIVAQTTISDTLFNEITKGVSCEVLNTICKAQSNIQNSSVELAKKMDIMYVVGGEASSNTEVLYQKCKKVCKTYKFSDINEFFKFNMNNNVSEKTKIGITGGASTPLYQIEEYKDLLEFIIYYKKMYKLFSKNIVKINNSFKENDNKLVIDAIDKLSELNKDGKYIRATLIALGYNIGGGKDNKFLPLSLAYETFQTAILIHDDIIDNATTRRGKETIPTLYNKEFDISKDKDYINERNHLADSMGLCIGDLGFYLANQLVLSNYKNHPNVLKVFSYYNNIVIKTIKGEIIDVMLPFKEKYKIGKSTLDDVMNIYHLKTSWYTIIGPFVLGLLLSNGKNVKKYEEILDNIGISFQIKDDIIGIFNNADVLGKSNQSDINEYKQTILYSYTMNTSYKDELLKYYGKKLNDSELESVRNIFINSGALEYANNKMEELLAESIEKIGKLNISDEYKSILKGLIIYLKIRKK